MTDPLYILKSLPVPNAEGFAPVTGFSWNRITVSPTSKTPPKSPFRTPQQRRVIKTPDTPKKKPAMSVRYKRVSALITEDVVMEDPYP